MLDGFIVGVWQAELRCVQHVFVMQSVVMVMQSGVMVMQSIVMVMVGVQCRGVIDMLAVHQVVVFIMSI